MTTTYTRGARVRIRPGAYYRTPGGTYAIETFAMSGAVGVIIEGPDRDGDYLVEVDGGGRSHDVSPECFAPEAAAATATVRVDVRFFVGDVDVTDKVGALVIEGLS